MSSRLSCAGVLLSLLLVLACAGSAGAAAGQDFAAQLARADGLVNQDARAAELLARGIVEGAQAAGDALAEAEARRVLGRSLNVLGSNPEALEQYALARSLLQAQGRIVEEAMVLRHAGVSYYDLGEFDRALEHYLEALALFEAGGQGIEAAKTRANIANVHYRYGRHEEAAQMHRAALAEFERAQVPAAIAGTALNLGAVLSALADAPEQDSRRRELLIEAAEHNRKALAIFRSLEVLRGVLKAESNLAGVQERLGDLHGAQAGYARALELADSVGDQAEALLGLRHLVGIARQHQDQARALDLAQAGLKRAQANSDTQYREVFHRLLSELHEESGTAGDALMHARQADRIGRERGRQEMELRIAELNRRFEDQQRDRELSALRQAQALDQVELQRQRTLRNGAMVTGVLLLGVLLLYWSKARLRERSTRELELAARTDPLTGLLNRRGLRELVGLGELGRQRHALVICDIDDFKRINDLHGHDLGDVVLAETAARLRAELRPDDHAARWGGEEFLLVLPGLGQNEASAVAERLRLAVAATPVHGIAVHLSLGTAVAATGESFDQTVRAADQALLQAKREGKNRVITAPGRLRALSLSHG